MPRKTAGPPKRSKPAPKPVKTLPKLPKGGTFGQSCAVYKAAAPPKPKKEESQEALIKRLLAINKKQVEAGQAAAKKRQKYHAPEEKAAAKRERVQHYDRSTSKLVKEIGVLTTKGINIYTLINWNRRLLAKYSLKYFCETYLSPVFYLTWSEDQLICISKAEKVVRDSGKFSLAMPRGGGKTAICRAAILWATLFGHKKYVYNVASTEPKSNQTVEFVKVQLSRNTLLLHDFPEVCWPLFKLEGTNRLAGGQTYLGEQTFPYLGADLLRFPTLQLSDVGVYREMITVSGGRGTSPKENPAAPAGEWPLGSAEWYASHDPETVRYVEHLDKFIPANAGVIVKGNGIDGSIRGEADADPITLEQPRPDLVLLDDVQKDAKADSPLLTDKLIRLIEGAVAGLSGPNQRIDALMPCTVIREGDASDQFLNPLIKPDWQGERCQMVKSWPPGVTDFEVTLDTPAGKAWNEYSELRRTSLRDKGTFAPATEYYKEHQKVMDKGYVVSWPERYDRRTEVSAQQHAMNLRLELGSMFLPEYQNIGRKLIDTADLLITAKQLVGKQIGLKRGHMAPGHQRLVIQVDIQDEIFFYAAFATDLDYNGTFVDYGTWPEIKLPYFTKSQTQSWSLLTKAFFEEYPQHKDKAISTSGGKLRAPFEAKIYHALDQAIPLLLNKEYRREDETGRIFKPDILGIDTRWGQASEVIKRWIRERGNDKVVPYYGQAMPPTNKQFEEYEMKEGWLFEQQVNPLVREPKWVLRPNPDGMWYLQADVNRLKDFLFSRFSVPMGAPGCVTIHEGPAEYHELFANHICSSEYPEPVTARGITKNMWQERMGSAYDNDWLDCAAACMALASLRGVSLKTSDFEITPIRRRLSDIRDAKRKERGHGVVTSTRH